MKTSPFCQKIAYGLGFTALCLALVSGFLAGIRAGIVAERSIIAFASFGILGYCLGWLLQSSVQTDVAFIYYDSEDDF